MPLKKCNTCCLEKEETGEFFRIDKRSNRFISKCKSCEAEYKKQRYLMKKEDILAKNRLYYKDYYQKNKNAILEQKSGSYRDKNPEVKNVRFTDEEKEMMIRLRKQRKSYSEIANSLGKSKDVIKYWCRTNGLGIKMRMFDKTCEECGEEYKTHNDHATTCSTKCSSRRHNRIGKTKRRIAMKRVRKIDNDVSLTKLIKRDDNLCYLCGEKCDDKDYKRVGKAFVVGRRYPTIDHVVPISGGGTHTWDNVKLAHHHCNTLKGSTEML